ncbi:serine hydrolase [Candidatus Amesbacteria bacterium]|nr:serine hydrolase [Candidatus Amesbacteria bacterium]
MQHQLINNLIGKLCGQISIKAIDLQSGDTIEHSPDTLIPSASTIKLAILVELLCRIDNKTISADLIVKAIGLKNLKKLSEPYKLLDPTANPTSALEMCELLTKIYQGKIPNSKYALALMGDQVFRNRIPYLLPNYAQVYNKTGTLDNGKNIIVNDVGIVVNTKNSKAFVLSFLSKNQQSIAQTSLVIAEISKILFKIWLE